MNLKVTSVASGDVGLANRGYWGIGLRDNNTYKVSFWAKRGSNFSGTLIAKLESNEGKVYHNQQILNQLEEFYWSS